MRTMTFRDSITLKKMQDCYGHSSGKTAAAEKTVRCCLSLPGLYFQATSESAGRKTDLTAHLWRSDFESDSYNYAEISGTLYRINDVGAGANDLYVRLSLERGY